jgi:hypothetical protein
MMDGDRRIRILMEVLGDAAKTAVWPDDTPEQARFRAALYRDVDDIRRRGGMVDFPSD